MDESSKQKCDAWGKIYGKLTDLPVYQEAEALVKTRGDAASGLAIALESIDLLASRADDGDESLLDFGNLAVGP